jgi:Holliday junction DNA helicase RuvB
MTDDRFLNPQAEENDEEMQAIETSLRPQMFSDVIGREKEKRSLDILIKAAKKRNEALDHILLHGPPGLGKTSLAQVIARETGVDFYSTSGPAIERKGDLASILTNIQDKGILFIDEIHRLNRSVEEMLYSAMEDKVIDIIIGKGPSARTLKLELNDLTIIGATTRVGLLTSPLRDRFGLDLRLDYYAFDEILELLDQKSKILQIKIDAGAKEQIARRSRRTPRLAIRILKRARDLAQVEGKSTINSDIAARIFELIDIDDQGLDRLDRKIINAIIEQFHGGPVGLTTLAATVSEDLDTIQDVYEPYLLQEGFLVRTPRGREVTEKALKFYDLKHE